MVFFLFYGDLMGILPTRMWILILDNDLWKIIELNDVIFHFYVWLPDQGNDNPLLIVTGLVVLDITGRYGTNVD